MKKNIFTLILTLFASLAVAQINLVYNGSFEDTVSCPITISQIYLSKHWTGIDSFWTIYDTTFPNSIPDLEHTCTSDPACSIPFNRFFTRFARTGSAMAQVQMYNTERDTTWAFYKRDYLQGRLRNNLVAGKQYCVTFYTTIEQASCYAVSHIGAYLDGGYMDTIPIVRAGEVHTMFHPQVFDTAISNDTLHWTQIQGTFTANGSEKFITIGNFFTNDQVDTVQVHYPSLYGIGVGLRIWSWYLVDDVSVIATDAVADAGRDTTITLAATDSAFVGVLADYVPCRWYTMAGALIDSNIGGFMVKPPATTSYIMELDVCGHITRDTVTVRVQPVGIATPRPSPREREVLLWPNPVGDELTITGVKDCIVEILDVEGRTIVSSNSTTEKTVVDVSKLVPGVYFVKVTEPFSGISVTRRLVKE